MASRKGWYIAGAIVVAGALLTAVAISQQQLTLFPQAPQAETRPVYTAVRVGAVQRGPIAQVLSYTGDVKAKTQVTVIPKTAGRIQSLDVDVGDRLQAGQLLASLEHDVLDAQVQQAMAGLALASAKLAGLEDGPRAETVAQAEANVRLAEARLAALTAGATPAQVEAAQAAVRAANNQVYVVQAQADSLLSRMGSGFTQDMKSAQTGVAYEQVKQAEAQLAALTAPPTRENLDQAEAAVDAARQQLALAQNPYTENDLGAARAAVAQAEASVRLATIQRKNATVESPVSGVVSARFVSTGDMAAPTVPMLTIMDGGMEVQIAVEEAMVSQVSVGKPVTITVASYPGVSFAGKVTSTAPSLDPRTRALAAKVQVEDPGARLKSGMFAQVSVTASSRDNVLLIPKAAVVSRGQRQIVFVASQGAAVLKEVQTGLTDGSSIEVISGLTEADSVILNNLSDLADGDPVQVQGAVQ